MAAGEDARIAVGVALGVIALWYVILLRWFLAYYVVADDWEEGSVFTALKKRAQITRGSRIKLFFCLIVVSLLAVVGVLACVVGLLVTSPIATCATASIYQQLKESAARPDAQDRVARALP